MIKHRHKINGDHRDNSIIDMHRRTMIGTLLAQANHELLLLTSQMVAVLISRVPAPKGLSMSRHYLFVPTALQARAKLVPPVDSWCVEGGWFLLPKPTFKFQRWPDSDFW